MAKWWQKLRNCPGEPQAEYNDDRLECFQYCSSAPPANARLPMVPPPQLAAHRAQREAARQWHSGGRPVLKMCGMKNVGHDLNTPYHGYPFDVAW
jgi:hypothetical protein